MARIICKILTKDCPQYFEYSTIVDAPVTPGMTLDVFKEYYKEMNGRSSLPELDRRLERVEAKGTSSYMDESVEDVVLCNRSGDNEETLTYDELVEKYFSEPPISDHKEIDYD